MDLAPLYNADARKHDRLVCCDWLEEQGDPRAMPWRWVISTGRRPHAYKNRTSEERFLGYTFDWYSQGFIRRWNTTMGDPIPFSATLPPSVQMKYLKSFSTNQFGFAEYNTAKEAYDSLVGGLVEAERKGEAPWQKTKEKVK